MTEIKFDALERFRKDVHINLNPRVPDKETWGDRIEPDDAITELMSRGIETDVIDALKQRNFEVFAYAKPWLSQELSNKTLYIFND